MSEIRTLPDGRVITLDRMPMSAQMDIMEAAGGNASANSMWLNTALAVCSVTAIDNVPVPRPTDKKGIRALADKLGPDGFGVAAAWLYGREDELPASAEDKISAAAEDEGAAKNS